MNQEVKQKWIAALEGDEYEQTEQYLRTPNGYCCLGVLCDLFLQSTAGEKYTWKFHDGFKESWETPHYEIMGNLSDLPRIVREWAELDYSDPLVQSRSLSEWNDGTDGGSKGEKKTFKEIAQLIREHL